MSRLRGPYRCEVRSLTGLSPGPSETTWPMCYVEQVAFRTPRAGEFYLSGGDEHGKPTVYRAPSYLGARYHVVRPVRYAIQAWTPGDPVNLM